MTSISPDPNLIGHLNNLASGNHVTIYVESDDDVIGQFIQMVINQDDADIADPPCILTMQPWQTRELVEMLITATQTEPVVYLSMADDDPWNRLPADE